MNKFIDLATQRLRAKLSDKKSFYNLDDLRSAGLPQSVIQPIEKELVNQLYRELEIPQTEWASLKTDEVRRAWNKFMKSAEDYVRIPDYKLNAVLKSVVNKLYPLIVWPRTQIPKFIFRDNEELQRDEIAGKVEKLPVNQHLGAAVVRYINKKNLDRLSREKCKEVIQKIDEKLVERYTPKQWVGSVKPLFELAGGPVPSELLASYFFHRELRGWSNKLSQIEGRISEKDFQNWMERNAEEQPASQAAGVSDSVDRESTREKESEHNLNKQFSPESESRAPGTTREEEPVRMSNYAESDRFGESFGKKEESPEDQESRTAESPFADESAIELTDDEPIWRRFVSEKDSDSNAEDETVNRDADQNSGKQDTEGGYQLNELFKEESGELDNESARELHQYLTGRREYFIRQVFRGSLSSYEQAVRKLSSCDDWEEAYPYIDREIFDRNDVDLYSKPALQFTDTMQRYFENR